MARGVESPHMNSSVKFNFSTVSQFPIHCLDFSLSNNLNFRELSGNSVIVTRMVGERLNRDEVDPVMLLTPQLPS